MANLKHKAVLISGSTSGIGQGIAVHMASLGCRVAITGRNTERLQVTADNCIAAGASERDVIMIKGDVTKELTVRSIIDRTLENFGGIDVLVNNAGVAVWDDIEDTSLEHFDTAFNTNVRGPFHLTTLAVPYLIHSKGTIINVSNGAGSRPVKELLTYGMSKAALDHFTKTLAVQLGPKGVRVNAVSIGEIRTTLNGAAMGLTGKQYETYLEKSCQLQPLGRIGRVEDVAKAVTFLCSSDASYITGVTLPVDGGWHCIQPSAS